MSPSLTKRMQIGEEELERRRAVAPRRSPKTLSHVSRCRISTDGASEACSPGRPCTQSPGWGRLEGSTAKETGSRERQKEHPCSRSARSPSIAWERSRRPHRHAASMHTHTLHVPNFVGAPRKKIVFHKMSFELELDSRNATRAMRGMAMPRQAGGGGGGARRLLLFSLT
jgi:hypothetical protein